MAPGYLLFAAGYDFKKGDWLSLFFAPVTGKMTFVLDETLANAGAFGVEPAVLNPLDSTHFPVAPKIANYGGVENTTGNHHGIGGDPPERGYLLDEKILAQIVAFAK